MLYNSHLNNSKLAIKFGQSEGHPCIIKNAKEKNLKNYQIYGNSYQSPTGGKNLFNISKIVGNTNIVNNSDGTLTLKNIYSISTSTTLRSACPALKVGDVITFSAKSIVSDGSNGYNAIYLSTSKSYWNFNNSYTVTESDLNSKLCFYNATSSTAANVTTTISEIQVEIGDTATEYEPYIPAPSPEYPSEIESVGDLTEKNLATAQQVYSNATNYSECIEDGRNCIRCTSDGTSYAGINFKEKTQYTVRFEAKTVTWSAHGEDTSTEVLFAFTHTDGTRKVIAAKGDTDWTYYEATSLANKTIASVGMYSYNYKHWIYINVDTFQIEEGSTATDYEPYHKYKIPVLARGRNLIPMFTFNTFTTNGVTFTNNKDGSITINGTPTGYAATSVISLPESSLEVLRNNACVLTGFYKCLGSNVTLGIDVFLDSTLVKQYYISTSTSANYIKVDLRSLNFNKINLNVKRSNNDKLIDNVTVKPFLEVGTTMPTSFEPYIAPVTTNIFLDEPLWRIGNIYFDYTDFEKQKVVRNLKMIYKLIGTPVQYGKVVVIRATSSPLGVGAQDFYSKTAIRCSHIKGGYDASGVIFSNATGRDIQFYLSDCGIDYTSETALDEFNALVAEWNASGKFQMMYPVATPIEEDITLPALPQFKGTTIYEVQTNLKPKIIKTKYIRL